MSSTPDAADDRSRKTVEDVLVFGAATAGAVYATMAMGPLGLGVGCVLLSVAAAVVVGRESGVYHSEEEPSAGKRVLADGGRED